MEKNNSIMLKTTKRCLFSANRCAKIIAKAVEMRREERNVDCEQSIDDHRGDSCL